MMIPSFYSFFVARCAAEIEKRCDNKMDGFAIPRNRLRHFPDFIPVGSFEVSLKKEQGNGEQSTVNGTCCDL
jgi:hypothetical protein